MFWIPRRITSVLPGEPLVVICTFTYGTPRAWSSEVVTGSRRRYRCQWKMKLYQ